MTAETQIGRAPVFQSETGKMEGRRSNVGVYVQINQLLDRTERRLKRRGKTPGPSEGSVPVKDPRGEPWFERLNPEIQKTILDSMSRTEIEAPEQTLSESKATSLTNEIIVGVDKEETIGTQPDSSSSTPVRSERPVVHHWSSKITGRGVQKGTGRYSFRALGSGV